MSLLFVLGGGATPSNASKAFFNLCKKMCGCYPQNADFFVPNLAPRASNPEPHIPYLLTTSH